MLQKYNDAFLCADIHLNKIGPLLDLLEVGGYCLCDRRFLYDLISFVVKEEMQTKDEIKNKHVTVIGQLILVRYLQSF